MDAYRRVFAQLSCKRCGVENRFEVTFRAGPLGPTDTFYEGQAIPPEERMQSGEVFRGTASRYCLQCLKDWQRAEVAARHKAMAGFVADGRLTLRRIESGTPLTADEVDALGRGAMEDITSGHGAPPPPTQNWVEFTFSWEGEEAFPSSRAYQSANAEIDHFVESHLVRCGWRWGRNIVRSNLRVLIDAGDCIRVECAKSPSACPVCTLEPAFEEPFDTCPRCGWINDPIQRHTAEAYGINLMTLQQAMQAWGDGKPVK